MDKISKVRYDKGTVHGRYRNRKGDEIQWETQDTASMAGKILLLAPPPFYMYPPPNTRGTGRAFCTPIPSANCSMW